MKTNIQILHWTLIFQILLFSVIYCTAQPCIPVETDNITVSPCDVPRIPHEPGTFDNDRGTSIGSKEGGIVIVVCAAGLCLVIAVVTRLCVQFRRRQGEHNLNETITTKPRFDTPEAMQAHAYTFNIELQDETNDISNRK